MKKKDLKKLALMGLTTGMLVSTHPIQAQILPDETPEQANAGASEGELLSQLSAEGQALYHGLDQEGQLMARLVAARGCGCGGNGQGKLSFAAGHSCGAKSCGSDKGGAGFSCGASSPGRGHSCGAARPVAGCGAANRNYRSDSSSAMPSYNQGTMQNGYQGEDSYDASPRYPNDPNQSSTYNQGWNSQTNNPNQPSSYNQGGNSQFNTPNQPSSYNQGYDTPSNTGWNTQSNQPNSSNHQNWNAFNSSPTASDQDIQSRLAPEYKEIYKNLSSEGKKMVQQACKDPSCDPNAAVRAASAAEKKTSYRSSNQNYRTDLQAANEMSESELKMKMDPSTKKMYDSLSSDGKKQALKMANDSCQDGDCDVNAAVRQAAMQEKKTSYRTTQVSRYQAAADTMTESQLKAKLDPSTRKVYDSLSSDGKKQALATANQNAQNGDSDVNAAVRDAASVDNKPGAMGGGY